MFKKTKPILTCLRKGVPDRMPVWLMRQAGRYLPEYRELRRQSPSFIDFCLSPEKAARVTLQPVERFNLDAAILFADILLVPHGLGQNVSFLENKGPCLDPLCFEKLNWDKEKTQPVMNTLQIVKKKLPAETALIGFSGGLWTTACYMIQEGGGPFTKIEEWRTEKEEQLQMLFDLLYQATLDYLLSQIKAGAEIIQIFESHAGLIHGDAFFKWIIGPLHKLCSKLKEKHSEVPIIIFARGAKKEDVLSLIQTVKPEGCGLDNNIDLGWAREKIAPFSCLQGNLDPNLLLEGGQRMKSAARRIFETWGRGAIFNLGHGVIKETPPEHVKELVSLVHGFKE